MLRGAAGMPPPATCRRCLPLLARSNFATANESRCIARLQLVGARQVGTEYRSLQRKCKNGLITVGDTQRAAT
jgi:hypothetical protein